MAERSGWCWLVWYGIAICYSYVHVQVHYIILCICFTFYFLLSALFPVKLSPVIQQPQKQLFFMKTSLTVYFNNDGVFTNMTNICEAFYWYFQIVERQNKVIIQLSYIYTIHMYMYVYV